MENLLDSLRLGKVTLSTSLIETLFESIELLLALVNGKGEDDTFTLSLAPIQEKITALLDASSTAEKDPLKTLAIDRNILNVLTEYEEHRLRENVKKGANILLVKVVV